MLIYRCVHMHTDMQYRISEEFGLEGTLKGHLGQPPAMTRDIFNQTRLLRDLSNLTFNVCRNAAATTSLGTLCFIILSVKNLCPV